MAPWIAVRAAMRLFETPLRPRQPRRELEWARGARRTTVRSPRGELAVWEWGNGDRLVVLVHGWAGRGLQLGAMVAPLVRHGFKVVAYDAPAHGESEGTTSSLLHFMDAMAAVGRELGPPHAVVAHSLGATAAFLAVARNRVQASRLVALAPAADILAVTARFGAMTGFTPAVMERMRARFQERLGFSWSEIEPLALGLRMTAPMLVVHDRDDREVPCSEGEALAGTCRQGELVVTSGLGHRRLLRDEAVVDLVVKHVCSNEERKQPGIAAAAAAGAPLGGISEESRT